MSFADIMAKKMKKNLEKNLKSKTLNEENIKDFLKELRVNLLEADVNYRVIQDLIKGIKTKATGEFIEEGFDARQMLLKIVHEEFSRILGEKNIELVINSKPYTIMLAGLQGSGKTTTAAKLASFIKNKFGKKCLLVACDTQRLAAVEQLQTLGTQLEIPVFSDTTTKNATIIAVNAKKYAIQNDFEVVIIDTAGRLHIDEVLMQELKTIEKKVTPDESLLVIDSMAGQEMINIAETFIENLQVKGFIITKLDGSARAGVALSLGFLTKLPIKFMGSGEKLTDLEMFYPKRMADRILGMGDIETLLEKVKSNVSERDINSTMERMMLGQFDLNDFMNQMKQIQKMGKLGTLTKLIPGIGSKLQDSKINEAEKDFKVFEAIINSTTPKEREKPQLLRYPTRRTRVLKGSGQNSKNLNKLLSQFEKTKKTMDLVAKQVKNGEVPNIPNLENLINSK